MTITEYNRNHKKVFPQTESEDGYKVIYPDGYVSWSPRLVFEAAYREIRIGKYFQERKT